MSYTPKDTIKEPWEDDIVTRDVRIATHITRKILVEIEKYNLDITLLLDKSRLNQITKVDTIKEVSNKVR